MKEIELKVVEAETKDVGRVIARIDPNDMQLCEIEAGGIVEIQGKRSTVAKVMPTYPQKRKNGIIQIDGITRKNAEVGIDDQVKIRRVSCKDATLVIFLPKESLTKPIPSETLKAKIEAVPLTQGDLVRITLFGTQTLEFIAEKVEPELFPVIIRPKTEIRIKGAPRGEKPTGACYEDVGGLHKQIQRLREMIELPLRYPEVFERLGIGAPKGVLLYGPTGCGKTLLARAVANETDAYFTHASGPEIIHKFYGESEAHLRKIFETAQQNAPGIIFLDEIEAIGSKREEVRGDQQVERRVTAQLLALMDGLKERGQVVVISATNTPDLLDPSLRRPGRFDREIEISVPDIDGRREILDIHTRGMPLAEDVELQKLAEITHGFSGADLESLCREAAMNVLRTVIPDINFALEKIPYEKIMALEVKMDDFREALKEVRPSLLREAFLKTPDVTWDDVGGLDEVKQILQDTIEYPLKYGYLFEHVKTSPSKGILLYGPPGTGKTLVAKAVAKESGVNFVAVKGPQLMSMWVGKTEEGIRELFKRARQTTPCIIFFDEIDAIAPRRSGLDSSRVSERAVSQIQTELDGIEELKGVVVLAATNRKDLLDEALLRAGRFDFQIEFPIPDRETKRKIFEIHTRGKPLSRDIEIERLIDLLGEGATGADIESLCRKASLLAIREFIHTAKDVKDKKKLFIRMSHFEKALKSMEGSGGEKKKFKERVEKDF
ncbi:MAG: AAA family ATPase [Candidatus Nealsonbacteria bacterium CG_4_9_14_0_2_um_filter_37_38]|nr:MAG: AAA family ATPase [Candidatus Nealsonbacteria bacterium CG11_big_fil_rev_8_21_14_0_20_37_68]PIW91894.1 MAG: AAA family ATPase [Candidatus Nealsonbacteria bacterium CG_4_8_14_3_um_filter_37_23]PJC51495.1 MAG: AAA family ATPase [Candidatus Nealsonbacteria bacterium CG_4_9_14_0_2_um_filter_37_38]